MQPTNGGKEGDDSSGGREGEKGGGLLLNYSISGDHPGLILYRDDEDVFHCVLCVFLEDLLGTV